MNTPTQAKISPQKQLSAIWIIPLIALGIGAWMLYQYVQNSGPEITLKMSSAEGVIAGKTEIKSLNVKVGVVKAVKLSENYDSIIVTAQMNKDAKRMLKADTLFWIVKPRIGQGGISGLDTLLSGAYIQMQPGQSQQTKSEFNVLDTPPVASPDAKGLRIVLTNDKAGKLAVGDPVSYQGFTVGRVEKTGFNLKQKLASYQLFIQKPYDDLVRQQTRFWLNSGVDFQLNSEGINVQMNSLESLIAGGVSFGVPQGEESGEPVKQQFTHFQLFDTHKQVQDGVYNKFIPFIMLFNQSVRGLYPGAPVEYRGLRIGTVEEVPFHHLKEQFQFSTAEIPIPILVHIEYTRIFQNRKNISLQEFRSFLTHEFNKGLKGTLKAGNLLTGALYIDTEFAPSRKKYRPRKISGYDVFPTKQGGLAEVQSQLLSLLRKINQLPLNQTVHTLNHSMNTFNTTLTSAQTTMKRLNEVLGQKNTQTLPKAMQDTLSQLQHTLAGFNPDSTVYNHLEDTLKQLEKTLSDLDPVLRQLQEKPNSIVFGKDQIADPMPVKQSKKPQKDTQ
jgi:paraquat-inducible protein B